MTTTDAEQIYLEDMARIMAICPPEVFNLIKNPKVKKRFCSDSWFKMYSKWSGDSQRRRKMDQTLQSRWVFEFFFDRPLPREIQPRNLIERGVFEILGEQDFKDDAKVQAEIKKLVGHIKKECGLTDDECPSS